MLLGVEKDDIALCCPMQGQAGPSRNAQLKDNRDFDGEGCTSVQTHPGTFTRNRPANDGKSRGTPYLIIFRPSLYVFSDVGT